MAANLVKEFEKLIWRQLPQDRLECYKSISEKLLKENNFDAYNVNDVRRKLDEVLKILLKDIKSEVVEVAQSSLQVLGFVLLLSASEHESIFTTATQLDIVEALCSVISNTGDKQICTRSLWCLSKQNFSKSLLSDKIDSFLKILELAQSSTQFQSMTVEHESINLIIRLLDQIPDALGPHVDRWGKLLYPHLVHNAPKVRERSYLAMELALPLILEHGHTTGIGKQLVADLRTLLISDLRKLMGSGHEVYSLKVWMIYVKLLGTLLHHGSLINLMLPIPEQGFKNSSPEVKCMAYNAWKVLIDCFARDPAIISDQKRVKLIMQVFKINNAKNELIASEKLSAWWHFIVTLDVKAAMYFEQVVAPLLQFVVGGGFIQPTVGKPGTPVIMTPNRIALNSPATPNISVSIGTPNGSQGGFILVMKTGLEILARLLGCGSDDIGLEKAKFAIAELKHDIITGISFYQKYASLLIDTFKSLILTLGSQADETLLYHIWYSLVAHTKNALEHGSKKDSVEVFTGIITCFQDLVTAQCLDPSVFLKMMEALLCLPSKVLSSPAYNISSSRNQMMQGCPALVVVELLFHHRILETQVVAKQERFFILLEKLVKLVVSNQGSALQSCDSMLQLVENASSSVNDKESLWRMWSAIASPLLEHITKSNEVNQGDVLEYNFSCLTLALTLPVIHILSSDITQGTLTTLSKTWSEMYSTFNRLAAMVSNAEANIACEQVCHKIVTASLDFEKSPVLLQMLAQALMTMVEQVDFSSLANNFGFLGTVSHSPVSFGKKKHHKSLGNISGLVALLGQVMNGLHVISTSNLDDTKKAVTMSSLQTAAIHIIQVTTSLFNHLPTTAMITAAVHKLAKPLGALYADSTSASNKIYSSLVLQKLEKLWLDLTTCIQSRYSGIFDNEFLEEMSPLLENTFKHSRRAIKNQTLILWNATFAKESILEYPEKLKDVLQHVKQKNIIMLPGWDATQLVVEETPVSQMTQMESQQIPFNPNIIGFKSPVKNVGSFLNKTVSPNIKSSPLKKVEKSPGIKKAVRSLSDMNDNDFVVINNQQKKKRVLTEHQKEVMKERSTLPVMYNNLDVSQDRSLMSQFLSTDSQMSQISTPTPTADMKIAPFPFILPDKPADKVPTKPADKPATKPEPLADDSSSTNDNSKDSETSKQQRPRRRKSVRFQESKDADETAVMKNADDAAVAKSTDDAVLAKATESKKEIKETKQESKEAKQALKEEKMDTDSEVLIIESETQEDPETTIYIGSETQESQSKPNCEMEGSETQSSQYSETQDIEPLKDPEVVKKEPQFSQTQDDGQGTPKQLKVRTRRTRSSDVYSNSQTDESEDTHSEDFKTDLSSQTPKINKTLDKNVKSTPSQDTPKRKRGRPPGKKTEDKLKSPQPVNSITKWIVKSPLKPEPVTLVEDSQFSMEEALAKSVLSENLSIKETPIKGLEEIAVDLGEKKDLSKNLFGNLSPMQDVQLNTEINSLSTSLKPVVQLERLTNIDIKKHNKSVSGSDSDCSEISGKENKAKSGQLKRRSSLLKFSKAGKQEQDENIPFSTVKGIPPVNMDDIVPCSQDSFAFKMKKKYSACETKEDKSLDEAQKECAAETTVVQETEMGENEHEAMEIVAGANKTGSEECSEDMGKQSVSQLESAISNPDIIPVGSSELDESESSQQTIVSTRRRVSLDDDTDSSQTSDTQGRTKRPRTPKKNFCSCHSNIDEHQASLEAKRSPPQSDSSEACASQEDKPMKKKRGRPRKSDVMNTQEQKDKLLAATLQGEIQDEAQDTREDNETDVANAFVSEKSLDDIINKKCNLDHDSDEESKADSDVPLSKVKCDLDSSTDDIPLSELHVNTDDLPLAVMSEFNSAKSKKTVKSTEKARPVSRKRKRGLKKRISDELEEKSDEHDEATEEPDVDELAQKVEIPGKETEKEETDVAEKEEALEKKEEHEQKKEETETQENNNAVIRISEKIENESEPVIQKTESNVTNLVGNREAQEVKSSPKKNVMTGKTSPPKKGKPFDIPDTPTSANKKYSSRASYILEQARKISMSKAFTSPSLVHRKKFTGIKSSPRLSRPLPGSGILKLVNQNSVNSPPQSKLLTASPSFRPVNIPRVYSPSASPSAGILKKRRLTGDMHADSPSPPCKQRRVCFNEELDVCLTPPTASPTKPVNRCLQLAKGQNNMSPLAAAESDKGKNTKQEEKKDNFVMPKSLVRPKDSQQMSMSQMSVSITQESQLNAAEPICPRLAGCDAPVEQVLPQLTSSTWVRGLSKVVRAQNIKTVGDLSRLTECEIHNLPIRSPKVQMVRKVLDAYSDKKFKATSNKETSPEVATEPDASSPSKLPNLDEELERMSPIKGDLDTSIESEEESPLALDATTDASEELPVDDTPSTSNPPAKPDDIDSLLHEPKPSALQLVEQFTASMTEELLASTPRQEMLQVYKKLNKTLQSMFLAMMNKGPQSPIWNQDSDSDQ